MNTITITNKVKVPLHFVNSLNSLKNECQIIVKQMLKDRTKNSTKYWKSIPSVVSKSLIAKYQRNKKCKTVKNLVIPISGDKGTRVKLENNKIKIPSLFKKETIDIFPLKPIVGNIRYVEFSKVKNSWFMYYSYNTPTGQTETKGFIGIDRNARGNIATIANPETGQVRRLGPDIKGWKDNLKNRKAKLQKRGAKALLKKINTKQSNRTRDINHKVSKQIVDYAIKHRKAIVLEELGKIKDSKKCGNYVQKSNWAFYQLAQFIVYKASLYSIPIHYINPKNTSKKCSRCGIINDVSGKKFKCKECGHLDHRDANAAFNIAASVFDG